MNITMITLSDASKMGGLEHVRDGMIEAVTAGEHVFVIDELGEVRSRLVNVAAVDAYLSKYGRKI